MKLLAFGLGAGVAGGVGAVFASWQGGVFPNNFDFPQLVTVYAMLILGGVGNIWGVVLAAAILAILPESLREYGDFRMILYGLLLVVMMAFRPQGLLGGLHFGKSKVALVGGEDGEGLKSAQELFYDSGEEEGREPEPARPIPPPGRVLLELKDLSMDFGGLRALSGFDLEVRQGEIVSLIGPNGAGKTTVFNLISGIYPPTGGRIIFGGKEITGLKPNAIVKRGVARTFQSLRLFENMTVLENAMVAQHSRTGSGLASILLRLGGFLREEERAKKVARESLALFGRRLTGFREEMKPVNLSYANRRRLEMARALTTQGRLLLLDEPSAGMNPKETEEMTRFIRRLRARYGYTILVIEHKLGLIKDISDRVVVLDYGAKIAEGDYREVAQSPQVIEAYLGRKAGAGRPAHG